MSAFIRGGVKGAPLFIRANASKVSPKIIGKFKIKIQNLEPREHA